MPFVLHASLAAFLDIIIGSEMGPEAFAYIDYVVLGDTFEAHLKNLKEVFHRLRNVKDLKPFQSKCIDIINSRCCLR